MLKSLGYKQGENLLFPGPQGTLSFFWFEMRDFMSTTGVDASVFLLDAQGKQVWDAQNDWGLRTRTSISASSFDQEFQNKTVRAVRKAFGGTFYNDHFGHNRYTTVKPTKSSPASRGVTGVLSRVSGDLESLGGKLFLEICDSEAARCVGGFAWGGIGSPRFVVMAKH